MRAHHGHISDYTSNGLMVVFGLKRPEMAVVDATGLSLLVRQGFLAALKGKQDTHRLYEVAGPTQELAES